MILYIIKNDENNPQFILFIGDSIFSKQFGKNEILKENE